MTFATASTVEPQRLLGENRTEGHRPQVYIPSFFVVRLLPSAFVRPPTASAWSYAANHAFHSSELRSKQKIYIYIFFAYFLALLGPFSFDSQPPIVHGGNRFRLIRYASKHIESRAYSLIGSNAPLITVIL